MNEVHKTIALNEHWREVEVVYEDDHVLVLNKPAGLLVIPDRWDKEKDNVMDLLRKKFKYIANVHRLDKETSGILLLAKTRAALSSLVAQFRTRDVEKNYLALVQGTLPEPRMIVDLRIADDLRHPGLAMIHKNGKPAETQFELVERYRHFSLVKALPRTGRLHQVRVHLQAIGCPVVCDQHYGNGRPLLLSHLKKNYKAKTDVEKPLLDRQGLHAERVILAHPATNERVEWIAPLPKDMALAVKYLKKYALA